MKTLIIHPEDSSTDFLKNIYLDLDFTIVNDINFSKGKLRKLIQSHDRIVMMGHGSDKGLFAKNRFIIDGSYVQFLKNKDCLFIWCNSNIFVEKHKLSGFYTGMIVSEPIEANLYNLNYEQLPIDESNYKFSQCLKESILLSTTDIYYYMIDNYITTNNNEIVNFNKNNLFSR